VSHDSYTNPLSTKTPVMTIAAVLVWLDLEIEYVRKKQVGAPELVQTILEGTALHIEVMKAQLQDYALQLLDENSK
jgi:hypothetical protein